MKPTNEELEKYDRLIQEDVDEWDSRRLGADPAHTARLPTDQEREFHRQKREGQLPTSIRLPASLLADIKELAQSDNIGYQTYIKQVLSQHVRAVKESRSNRSASR